MATEPQSLGGGIFIVLSIAIGTAIGAALHQPSIGVVAGIAVGTAIAIFVWLRDRKHIGH
jgi:hypothetical protein